MLKSAHYAVINLLFNNGHSKRAIARLTSHDRKTVDKVLRAEAPAVAQRRIRKHKLDAFPHAPGATTPVRMRDVRPIAQLLNIFRIRWLKTNGSTVCARV